MSVHARIKWPLGVPQPVGQACDGTSDGACSEHHFSKENNKIESNVASVLRFLSKYWLRSYFMEIMLNIDVEVRATKWTARRTGEIASLENLSINGVRPQEAFAHVWISFSPSLKHFYIWNIYHTIWSRLQWSPFTWHSSQPWALVLSYLTDQETGAQGSYVIKRTQSQICLTPERGCFPLSYTLFYIISSYLFLLNL